MYNCPLPESTGYAPCMLDLNCMWNVNTSKCVNREVTTTDPCSSVSTRQKCNRNMNDKCDFQDGVCMERGLPTPETGGVVGDSMFWYIIAAVVLLLIIAAAVAYKKGLIMKKKK